MNSRALLVSIAIFIAASGPGQYRPWRGRGGIEIQLPGDRLMQVVIPEYDVRAKALLEVFKDLSRFYRLRFGIEMVRPTTFKERPVTLTLKNVTMRDLINRVVQAAGFSKASWSIAPDEIGLIYINFGPFVDSGPLSLRIKKWTAPTGEFPDNVLRNLVLYIPELQRNLLGENVGIIGSKGVVTSGCSLVYHAESKTVSKIIEDLSRIANKSWLFEYVPDDRAKSRIIVFYDRAKSRIIVF